MSNSQLFRIFGARTKSDFLALIVFTLVSLAQTVSAHDTTPICESGYAWDGWSCVTSIAATDNTIWNCPAGYSSPYNNDPSLCSSDDEPSCPVPYEYGFLGLCWNWIDRCQAPMLLNHNDHSMCYESIPVNPGPPISCDPGYTNLWNVACIRAEDADCPEDYVVNPNEPAVCVSYSS